MTKYIVQGGSPLFGEVHISGAKNAAVAILPAALLVDGVCRIENIPQISDVTVLLKILEQLGAKVRVLNRSDVELDCRHIVTTRAPQELAHKLRASYYFIGALLGRFGEAEVSMPGGCNFGGTRPIDQHVKGFAAMGATVREGDYICAAAGGRAHEGREHLSRRGLRRRDHEHHDGRSSGGRHDRHRKRGEGAAHRRSRQLPQLHGRGRQGRRHRHHPRRGRGAPARRRLRHHPRPDRGRHLHGGRCRHGRTDPRARHHP